MITSQATWLQARHSQSVGRYIHTYVHDLVFWLMAGLHAMQSLLCPWEAPSAHCGTTGGRLSRWTAASPRSSSTPSWSPAPARRSSPCTRGEMTRNSTQLAPLTYRAGLKASFSQFSSFTKQRQLMICTAFSNSTLLRD